MAASARQFSSRPMPLTQFLPGTKSPGTRPPEYAALTPEWSGDPARWRESADYIFGIDLFNAGFWWEAHEALEVVWKQLRAAGNLGAAKGVQAVIQTAAACIKGSAGNRVGVERLLARARANMNACAESKAGTSMGFDMPAWFDRLEVALMSDTAAPPIMLKI